MGFGIIGDVPDFLVTQECIPRNRLRTTEIGRDLRTKFLGDCHAFHAGVRTEENRLAPVGFRTHRIRENVVLLDETDTIETTDLATEQFFRVAV